MADVGRMKSIQCMMNQNNNNKNQASCLLEKQPKSLAPTNKASLLVKRFPMISQRLLPIISLNEAMNDENSLISIDKELGQGVSLDWIKGQLLDVFRICGAIEQVASIQIIMIARRIRYTYFYLSASELTYFFESFVAGGYGTLYVGRTINPQNIMIALRNFDTERANQLTERAVNEKQEIDKSKVADISFVNEICERIKKTISKDKL